MNYWIDFALVFFAILLADVCWTYYFIKVAEKRVLASGIWSSLIMALGSFSIERYTQDHTLIWAAIIGAFVGTTLSVKHKIWVDKKQELKNEKAKNI